MNSQTEENYLKALFYLSRHKDEVNVRELSERLEIKMPTVTSMMKKLAAKDLVHYESYKPVRLTDAGKKTASQIIRKHRLTETFLVNKMGFGWEEVDEIAEQLEHVHSPKFFEKMDELLGYPVLDPHGSPIPDKKGNIKTGRYKKITEFNPGDVIELTAVLDTSHEFLSFLNNKELSLGINIEIIHVESFDNSVIVRYTGHPRELLSEAISQKLLAEKR